jgi:predicted MFS family arabinose efflux permease
MSLALFVEAPLLAWAERLRVRFVSTAALAVLAAAMALSAAAPNAWVLLAALALYGPASGVALAASEGTLVEARPHERERTLTRITFAGIAGDALVPALLIALIPFGLGWRAVASLAAAAALALAIAHWRTRELDLPFASGDDEGDEEEAAEGEPRPPLRELAQLVRSSPVLVGWLLVALVSDLLDEALVAFAAAHLADFAATPQRMLAIAAWTLGDFVGIVALEVALRRARPLHVLRFAALVAALALAAFWLTRSVAVATLALGFVGAAAIAFHPLLKARAYAALPGRPAMVNAINALLQPAHVAAPLALAWVAGAHGTSAAMGLLCLAPLVVAVAAFRARDARALPNQSQLFR